MLRNRWKWALLIGILAVGSAVLLFRPYLADWLSLRKKETVQPITVGARTLIVAPHPDDETLGGAEVIQKALAAGKQVKVVIVTSGDGYKRAVEENYGIASPSPADYRRLGEARHLESLKAMKHFGLAEKDVMFLGYPDGGVNGLWESDWDYDHLHRGLNGSTHSPYAFSYEKNAPYCGANLAKNLWDIIREFQPTDIVYPDPNDQHHDHWGTNAFVKYVLTLHKYRANEWTYLVHRGDFPAPWRYEPNLPLHPPHVLSGLDTKWIYIPVSEQEKRKKHEAIRQYATQTKVMDPFLEAFVRTNELLGTYTDPTLPVAPETPDFAGSPAFPHPLFLDAHGDTVRREVEAAADIATVGGVLADGKLYIGLETRAPISPRVAYNVRIRLFRPNEVKRLDLTVHGTQVTAARYASNSLDLPPDTAVQSKDNRLWLTLPGNLLDGTTSILLSADSVVDRERIDKTAWRLVKIAGR
ncbi:PIG-L deacetylase family protein [Effusibacillus pohliae]|uniref:PIG-L deacetylase family protein n=1 Tax=Effusibacillus pohliae TaxID=232270 RepID=UPI00035DD15C|nr:PIG-L family deacetylase [Effusibacillus pohliae]